MAFGEEATQEETFLDVETGEATEPKAVSAGEHKLRIVGATIDIDKNGHPYFLPRFEIVGKPTARDFTKFHGLPHEDLDEKQLNAALWNLGQFKACFQVPAGKIPLNETVGLEGWAILGMKEDAEYGEQNTLRKYILPK